MFFFFQAEDGIRDRSPSRGLGDVYKRQDNHYSHTSLINAGIYDETDGAYNVGNIVICGNGQINGNGFKLAYNEGLNHKTGNGGIPYPSSPAIDQTIRGRLITIHNAQNVYMKDVQLAYGPSWTVHPIYCDSITFDNLDIVSKGNGETGAADDICILNGDGIDPDSSTNVNIFNTHFYTGDDAVAVKSGRNKEGNELNKPTAFIRITDCVSDGSKGGFAVGSENASGIKNALFQNLTIKNITLSHGILSLIHISEPTRRTPISYAVFCLKKKKNKRRKKKKTQTKKKKTHN